MAGLGYKDFTAGAVLTAAQVDGYLMEQAVMNFAGTAARGSALSSVQAAGMMAHVGGGTVTVYDGSAWQQVYPVSGGITLITSGTLSSSSVVLSNIPGTYKDLILIVRNFLPATDNANLFLRVNGDSSANRYVISDNDSSNLAFNNTHWPMAYGNDNGTGTGLQRYFLPDYANTVTWKMCMGSGFGNNATTPANIAVFPDQFGVYNQTSAITSLTMFPSSGNFTSGNYFLYGIA